VRAATEAGTVHTAQVPSRPSVVALACVLAALLASSPSRDARAAGEDSLELGAGVAGLPDFPGSRTSSARARVWVDATWRSAHAGTFAIDSGSLTLAPALRWSPFDDAAPAGASLLLGWRDGRGDTSPGFASMQDGSDRLRGLPDIGGSADLGLEANARPFGVPVFGVVRHALHGAQGTIADFGIYAPLKLGRDVELTLLPTLRWADAREMHAWFGIDPAAAASSGRTAYAPGAGLERAAFEAALDVPLSGRWHAVGSLAVARLLGDAAASPLAERRWQPMALVGVTWRP
jgi:outer membrane scaffolding protein for murein synthesis (MipA/OmpV family)